MGDPGNSVNEFFPEPDPLTPGERAAALARARSAFSAADLQRYTEEEEGIPLDKILEELEGIHRQSAPRPE